MKKFTLVVANKETPEETWEENYTVDTDNPQEWAKSTIQFFNSTLRPYEKERTLVDVIRIVDVPDEEEDYA